MRPFKGVRASFLIAAAMVLMGCTSSPIPSDRLALRVVTFNTGTTAGLHHDDPPDDGYTSAQAALSSTYYGDGLAWQPAVAAAAQFFLEQRPDIVVFQEIFFSGECQDVPAEAQVGFVCETWSTGAPTVAQVVLGEGYQVVCHPGKPDKCAGVRRDFGAFAGCDEDFCLEGLVGFGVEGCGRGARVARGVIDLVEGGTLTLVNYHGTSGLEADDQQCRVSQVEQVFLDLGDGYPGANGERNLIMGDLNTDPGRLAGGEASATRWTDFVGGDADFQFLTDVGPFAEPSYAGLLTIDHVISDTAEGSCWTAGVTDGHPPVLDVVYFDHTAVVCDLEL